jgi:glycolate oxidase FAD binding subunit
MAVRVDTPRSYEGVALTLAAAAAEGLSVRPRGGGTKLSWGALAREPDIELHTDALDAIVEHNVGDLTAVLEAGVPLARAQERFAQAGQMLAIDPPLGVAEPASPGPADVAGEREALATIGGVVATGDSGPLRHRFGAPRDLILGMTVALSDGTVARSGGKVIKNVAGYDIGKLFAGSFGTLGTILSVSVRLHPLPDVSVTALGATSDPVLQAAASRALAAAGLELDALDIAWRAGRGGVLARLTGPRAPARAQRAAALMGEVGLEHVDVSDEDAGLWARQRAGQRSADRAIVRVSAKPSALPDVIRASQLCEATVVGRAALGVSFVELEPEAVPMLRAELPAGSHGVVQDAPAAARASIDVWGADESPTLALMRRVKQRFDPAGVCNPGVFVGGI